MTKTVVLRRSCAGLAVLSLAVLGCDDPAAIPATLKISATTTGAAFDADDYVVLVDGIEIQRRLGLNEAMLVSAEPGHTMELELTDVADNCQVDGPARRTVTLADGSVTTASFGVNCVAPAGLEDARLVFATGTGSCPAQILLPYGVCELYTLPLDGSEGRRLFGDGHQPAVSADGSTVVFTRLSLDPCCADVYAVDVDGGNLRRITEDGRSSDPSWSPDGKRIVYVNGTRNPAWLQIRRLDDQDVLWLPTSGGAQAPVWSPDGSRIAFSSRNGIYSMAPDGSEAVLVAAGGRAPVWSPASDRLAYEFEGSVYAIGLNDEVGTPLLPRSQGTTWTPTDWSPNGEWIALTRGGDDVYLLHVDDGTMVRVTLPDFLKRSGDAVFVPGP